MLLFLIGLALGLENDKDSILVCFSDHTSPKLLELFSDFTQRLNLTSKSVENEVQLFDYISIIIDITKSSGYFAKLDSLSQRLNTFYISITIPSGETSSSLRFYLHPSQLQIENSISAVVDYLKWQEFSLFGSNQINDQLLAFNIRPKFNHLLKSFFVYENDLSDLKSDEIVRKLIKTQGVKNMLVIDDGDSLKSFQRALKLRKVPKFGTYLVFLNRGIYTVDIEGALIISEPGTDGSTSEETFEFLTISNFLKNFGVIKLTNLKKNCPSQICFKNFNLVNIQQGTRKIIGIVESKVNLIDKPVFPENNTSIFSALRKSKLIISIANGTSEIYNQGYIPIFAYWYQGARYAVFKSNILQEFENFEIDLFPTNCGNMIYDETWYRMCLGSVLENLGIAYLTSLWGEGAKGNLLTLRSLSKQIPQVSPLAILKDLESKSDYPEFLKLSVDEEFYSLSSIRIFEALKWRNFILLGSKDSTYKNALSTILGFINTTNLKIINPENLVYFPQNYTRDQFEDFKEYFEFAKKSKCRIFLIFSSVTQYIIEGLYDIGLRKGDFILISDGSINDILKEDIEKKYMKKRIELLVGSLVIGYKEWEGKLGKKLKEEMSSLFSDVSYMCLAYDSLLVVKNALTHLLAVGDDFEDPLILGKAMRDRKFVGCLGNVYFKSDANTRASYLISYKQIIYNKTIEQYNLEDFATINPFSTKLLEYLIEPQWPTGDKTTPTNYIQSSECGFDNRLIIKSKNGQSIIMITSLILLVLIILFSFLSWKCFKNSYKELEEKQEMNLNDYFYLLFFILEFFQLVSLGPKKGIFSFALNKIEFLLAIDLTNYLDFTFEKFWIIYSIVLAIAYIFILFSLLVYMTRKEFFENYYFLSKVKDFSDVVLPLVGHIGFIPMISQLFEILICEEGIGESLQESFLERDCSQFCYTGKHKVYLTAGTIALAGFLTISTFLRPYWEGIQYSLNLSTKPWYLLLLSVFQFICVACKKNIKAYSKSAPGFIISILIALLIVITVIKKPFNYSRVLVYQLTSLAMALWALIISSTYEITSGIEILVPILFIGLLIILFLGFFISLKYPKIFISEKSFSIPGLIRFQFTGKFEYLKERSVSVIEDKKDFD